MALTNYQPNATTLTAGQIKSFTFDTATAAGGTPVVITADAMRETVFTMADIAGENAQSRSGYAHATEVHGELVLQTLGEAGATTFMNQITNGQQVAYVKVTTLANKTIVLDSGVTDSPVVFTKAELMGAGDKDNSLAWKLTFDGIIAKQNVTVS